MNIKRIKDLQSTTYDGSYLIAVDDETNGTRSIRLDDIANGGSTIVGAIVPYGGTDTPEGFLPCDGSEVNKETYSDLYAVIGDNFGTPTDPMKFKLPKIDDARYLQGNTTPGQQKSEELPNITGKIDASKSGEDQESFGEIKNDTNLTIDGCFTDGQIFGNQYSTMDASTTSSSHLRSFQFNASKSNSIYKDNGAVQPKSVTVRYLICWKKHMGQVKADAVCLMPDWDDLKKENFTTTTEKPVKKNGYILFTTEASWNGEAQFGLVNGIKVFHFYGDIHDYSSCPYGVVPVSVGDKVKVTSTEYIKAFFYPAKVVEHKQ